MALSDKTRREIGRDDLPKREDFSNALGVQTTAIPKIEFSKAEEELLQTNALTVEDNDPFSHLYEITQKNALIKPTYDPWLLSNLTHQNNTLLQCVSAMEINIDGTGYAIEPKNPQNHEEIVEGEIDGETQAADLGEDAPDPDDIEEEPREFPPPPQSADDIIEDEKRKFEEREQERLREKKKQERIEALKEEEDEQRKGVEEFFDEPWPGMSFMTIRRKLRRDLETMGNAYMEVIRDVQGNIVFLNYLDAKLVRMVRLGEPVQVEEEITRFGRTTTVRTMKRERRFAMLVGAKTTVSNVTKVVYFKEFGASRSLNKWNGLWDGTEEKATPLPEPSGFGVPDQPQGSSASKETNPNVPGITGLVGSGQVTDVGGEVDPKDEATEIIHLTVLPDVGTLYGVPRWVNQIPSVLGSRKAEELNLEFFNSGGLPPAMILIQGGSLSSQSRQALTGYLGGEAKHKQRGIIAEVFSTSGDLTSAGNVRVSVERFGAERQQDAMFMKYDDNCWNHVRKAFRLPPLFLGDAKEHNFATAKASYLVAEAQVFGPERMEFDEIVNVHLMKEIAPEWVYRSKPLPVNDTESQLKALELAKDQIEQGCFVEQIGEVSNLELVCKEEPEEEPDVAMEVAKRMGILTGQPAAAQNGEGGTAPFQQVNVEGDEDGNIAKIDDSILMDLADDWAAFADGTREFEDVSVDAMRAMIASLAPSVRKVFNGYVAMKMMPGEAHDPEGTSELLSCAARLEADRRRKDDFNVGDLERDGGKLQPDQSNLKRKKPKVPGIDDDD